MAPVVGLLRDMLDRSRIQGVARAVGAQVEFVSDLDELQSGIGPATVAVFVDLTDPTLQGFRAPAVVSAVFPGTAGEPDSSGSGRPLVIGFLHHDDKEGFRRAQEAGFDEVLSRAAFFKRLSVILAKTTTTARDEG
jgi:hypothetical protein